MEKAITTWGPQVLIWISLPSWPWARQPQQPQRLANRSSVAPERKALEIMIRSRRGELRIAPLHRHLEREEERLLQRRPLRMASQIRLYQPVRLLGFVVEGTPGTD